MFVVGFLLPLFDVDVLVFPPVVAGFLLLEVGILAPPVPALPAVEVAGFLLPLFEVEVLALLPVPVLTEVEVDLPPETGTFETVLAAVPEVGPLATNCGLHVVGAR